jgi:hypothetical protein
LTYSDLNELNQKIKLGNFLWNGMV